MGSVKKYCDMILDVLVTAIVALICFTLATAYFLTYKADSANRIDEYVIDFFDELAKFYTKVVCIRDKNPINITYVVQDKVNTEYPAIVWWTGTGRDNTSRTITCDGNIKCEVFPQTMRYIPSDVKAYLFYGAAMRFTDLPLPRNSDTILWGMTHDESPKNTPELLHDKILSLFNYSSTNSQHSDVPITFLVPPESDILGTDYFLQTTVKNNLSRELAPIIYIQSLCVTMTDRDEYVQELMKYIPIDSYGTCLNNKELPKTLKEHYLKTLKSSHFMEFIARYKFIIAIENGACDDYITEKFWRAITVGVVPIYFGAPNIRDWLPNEKSAILITDYSTPQRLSEHIYKLMADDDAYEEYLEHKTKGKITNKMLMAPQTQTSMKDAREDFEYFMCGKVHELQINYGRRPRMMTRQQYNCARHMSSLTLAEVPHSSWMQEWHTTQLTINMLYEHILANKSAQLILTVDSIAAYVTATVFSHLREYD